MSWSPEKMKLSRAIHVGVVALTVRHSRQLRLRQGQRWGRWHGRAGGEAQRHKQVKTQQGRRECLGMARLRTEMVRSIDPHRDVQTDRIAHTCRDDAETPREILGDPFYTHSHLTRPALTHSWRGEDNPGARWQAGHYLSVCLPSPCPYPKTA